VINQDNPLLEDIWGAKKLHLLEGTIEETGIEIDTEGVHTPGLIVKREGTKSTTRRKRNKNIPIAMEEDKDIETDLNKRKANAREKVIADLTLSADDDDQKLQQ
jgi:hypothetical protein